MIPHYWRQSDFVLSSDAAFNFTENDLVEANRICKECYELGYPRVGCGWVQHRVFGSTPVAGRIVR